jgi:hypothetical protein
MVDRNNVKAQGLALTCSLQLSGGPRANWYGHDRSGIYRAASSVEGQSHVDSQDRNGVSRLARVCTAERTTAVPKSGPAKTIRPCN